MSPTAGDRVKEVLYSGYIGQGPLVEEFERQLRDYLSIDHLLTVNSGTSALQLALHIVGEQGAEVLTSPLTCFATTSSILASGMVPKWVDIDPHDYNLSLDDLERKLSPTTKVVVVVHFGGYPVDLERLRAILDVHERNYGFRPVVVEDCAHAFGGSFQGRKIGSHGNVCCFSFQAIKTLTTGDGGLVTFPTAELCERAKRLRWFGIDRDNREAPIIEAGFKYHMNDLQAAIGISNLPFVDELLNRQRENYRHYIKRLGYLGIVRDESRDCTGWMMPLKVHRRINFEKQLAVHGIEATPAHTRNDRHPCVSQFRVQLPNMDLVEEGLTCLPCGWWVDAKKLDLIADIIFRGW